MLNDLYLEGIEHSEEISKYKSVITGHRQKTERPR